MRVGFPAAVSFPSFPKRSKNAAWILCHLPAIRNLKNSLRSPRLGQNAGTRWRFSLTVYKEPDDAERRRPRGDEFFRCHRSEIYSHQSFSRNGTCCRCTALRYCKVGLRSPLHLPCKTCQLHLRSAIEVHKLRPPVFICNDDKTRIWRP